MDDLSHLFVAQHLALDKLTDLVGIEQINHSAAQCPERLQTHLEAFMRFEVALIGQVHVGYADMLHSGNERRA